MVLHVVQSLIDTAPDIILRWDSSFLQKEYITFLEPGAGHRSSMDWTLRPKTVVRSCLNGSILIALDLLKCESGKFGQLAQPLTPWLTRAGITSVPERHRLLFIRPFLEYDTRGVHTTRLQPTELEIRNIDEYEKFVLQPRYQLVLSVSYRSCWLQLFSGEKCWAQTVYGAPHILEKEQYIFAQGVK